MNGGSNRSVVAATAPEVATGPVKAAEPRLVIAAALAWLGTPYHDQASLQGVGCDCGGLLRGVWRAVVGPESFVVPPYGPGWGDEGPQEVVVDLVASLLLRIDPAQAGPGAVLLFRMRESAIVKHAGIITSPGLFIHATERHGVIEEALTIPWRRRIAGAFLYPAPAPPGRAPDR